MKMSFDDPTKFICIYPGCRAMMRSAPEKRQKVGDHMRVYLECRAGHYYLEGFNLKDMTFEEFIDKCRETVRLRHLLVPLREGVTEHHLDGFKFTVLCEVEQCSA